MTTLRDYEDYILVIASIMAAIADSLGADPRLSIYALILGATAKGLLSILSREKQPSPL